ncbi:hypothetical protein H0H93_007501 [Arthromyces matolae]|nr:hypothetical protein H0H93_007501 [Arthromyces matolae]
MFRACRAQTPGIFASSSSQSSLHTSAVWHAQRSREHVARAVRKANILTKEERVKKAEKSRPSVVLGTRPGEDDKWDKCLLARVLVDTSSFSRDFQPEKDLVPSMETIGEVHLPKETNFGVAEAEKQLIFSKLATQTALHGAPLTMSPHDSGKEQNQALSRWLERIATERRKADLFAQVIDLRNANAAGIAYENRKRIIAAFSSPKNPFDTGRTEVQAALLTYKIRNLWAHLTEFRRDVGNLRGLRMLVHQRAKLLKYLKKVDQSRYEILLEQLALAPESVEGELVV